MVPEHIKSKVMKIQDLLKALPMVCKFVEPENLHICLSFLGEVGEGREKKISDDLDAICNQYQSFDLAVLGVKAIPNERYFRVFVLDVLRSDVLDSVNWQIKERIGGDMKPPHLTLCRVRKVLDRHKVLEGVESLKTSTVGKFTVQSIGLVRSTLKKTGPVYEAIHNSRLISED